MTRIIDEIPQQPKLEIGPAMKDILIDGKGIHAQIEIGPGVTRDREGREVIVAYVSSKPDGDFKKVYKNLLPEPNQNYELYKIQAPADYWLQLNSDSRYGAWAFLMSFDLKPTALTGLHESLLSSLRNVRNDMFIMQMEIFRLRRDKFILSAKAENEVIKSQILRRKVQDQPMMYPAEKEGEK